MEFVGRLKTSTDFAGIRVSPLLIVAKAVIWAVRRNPTVNSSWTDKEITVHHYVNLGIAAATPRGLLVPNIKDAQELTLLELARALESMTIRARDGKTQPAEMANGTITITNVGSFGMDTGTPILNPGEAAILAMGTIKQKPWIVDGEVRSRFVTTVAGQLRPPNRRRRRREPLCGRRGEHHRGACASARLGPARPCPPAQSCAAALCYRRGLHRGRSGNKPARDGTRTEVMNLTLRPMSPGDLAAYIARSTEEYVRELVRAGMREEQARANADAGIASAFPGGVPANDNEAFDVLDGEQRVGLLWLGPQSPGTWYVMDIEIRAELRSQGYGRATMLLAEDVARAHGATHLGLNVFGHNPGARALYESLGYEIQAIRMRKAL